MMIKTEVTKAANRMKRKRNADDDDCQQVLAKAAKVFKEKKLKSKRPRKNEDGMKNSDLKSHQHSMKAKLKSTQTTTKPEGNKNKPKMVRNLVQHQLERLLQCLFCLPCLLEKW